MIEDAEEAVEEIGKEVLEGDSKEEDEEPKKENFSKNPSHNSNSNNNNVKKVFNRESAKRKVSIPLLDHMKSMEQEKVIITLTLFLVLILTLTLVLTLGVFLTLVLTLTLALVLIIVLALILIRDGKTRGRCGRVRAIFFLGCANLLAVYVQTS